MLHIFHYRSKNLSRDYVSAQIQAPAYCRTQAGEVIRKLERYLHIFRLHRHQFVYSDTREYVERAAKKLYNIYQNTRELHYLHTDKFIDRYINHLI